MDPMTLATINATIMGLICNFKQERRDQANLTGEDFTLWLSGQHRDDLKVFITQSAELPSEIDKLLKKDMDELLKLAGQMREALATLPSIVGGLAQTIQSTQSQSDRLKMLFTLIEKQEKAVVSLETQGYFLPRSGPDTEWELPLEVHELREYYTKFESMQIEDSKEWTFLMKEDAFHKEHVHIKSGNRVAKRESLLRALGKLIQYREELDYLEQKTRTPR